MLKKEDIITGNGFKGLCDDFLDEEKQFIDIDKKPKKIFLKTDWIELFKVKVLPKIDYNFTLITHNADRAAPSGNFDLLNDNRLTKWYGMNIDAVHEKLQPIPIGIANEKWPHGNKDVLVEICNAYIDKTNLVYSNFDINTNINERIRFLNFVQDSSFITHDVNVLKFESYLKRLKSFKYVISPPGNSIDCHRIWESIYLGVIPIVERHPALDFFQDLPILFVDNIKQITPELLEHKYIKLQANIKEKAYMSFYKNLLK